MVVIGGAVCLVLDPTSRRIIDGKVEKVDLIKDLICLFGNIFECLFWYIN